MFSTPPVTTQAQQQQQRRCYLGAVWLNNTAVTLLERGHCRQALEVLEGAVLAIREVMMSKKDSPHAAPENGPAANFLQMWMESSSCPSRGGPNFEDVLHTASRYVMDSGPAVSGSKLIVDVQVLDVEMPRLSTGTEIFPPVVSTMLLRLDAPQCPEDYAVCCRRFGTNQDQDQYDDNLARDDLPQLEAVTILYNYAAAARLHPVVSDLALRRGAIRVAHFAFCHVCRLFCPQDRSAGTAGTTIASSAAEMNQFEDAALLQLSLLLTVCTYQLYVDMGDLWGAGQSLQQHRLVLQAMDTDEFRHAHRLVALSVPHAKVA